MSQTEAYGTSAAATTTYQYGGTGEKISETDSLGHTTSYSYDNNGNKVSQVDPNLNETDYQYDSDNQLIKTTDANGGITEYHYDPAGDLLHTLSPEGRKTSYTYGSHGQLLEQTWDETNGGNTTISYTQNGYDSNLFVNSTRDRLGNITTYQNNPDGSVSIKHDAGGYNTQYHYDTHERLIQTDYPNGGSTHISYGDNGLPSSTTDELGNLTTYAYDPSGRVTSTTTPVGTTTTEYNSMGLVDKKTDANSNSTLYTYDLQGRLIDTKTARHEHTLYTYYANGLMHTKTDAMGNQTTYTYDADGNQLSSSNDDGTISTMTYDGLNHVITTANSQNNTITDTYDGDGNKIREAYDDGTVKKYRYDNENNLIRYEDGAGNIQTYVYENGVETRYYDQTGYDTSDSQPTKYYSYNYLGKVSSINMPNGNQTMQYDTMGNLIGVSNNSNGGSSTNKSYTYNLNGQELTATSNGATVYYHYNTKDQLYYRGSDQNHVNNGVSYTYDNDQNVKTIGYPDGNTVAYDYNEDNDLTKVKYNTTPLATTTYNADDMPEGSVYGNTDTDAETYDANGQLNGTSVSNSDGHSLYSSSAVLDAGGYATHETTQDATDRADSSYTYNAENQVTSANVNTISPSDFTPTVLTKTDEWTYDAAGNVTYSPQQKMNYSDSGALISSSNSTTGVSTDYNYGTQYTNNDNRTDSTTTDSTNNVGTYDVYGYDADNNLTSFYKDAYTTDQTTQNYDEDQSMNMVQYTYDADGLLSSRSSNSYNMQDYTSTSDSQDFAWDLVSSSVSHMLSDGTYDYVYGSSDTPLAQIKESDNSISYLHQDIHGSVGLVTAADGSTTAYYRYDAYGNIEKETGDTNHDATAFGFQGQYLDSISKLYYMRARWYDPSTDGFLTIDPLVELTHSGFLYGNGNPLLFNDPLGLWAGLNDGQKAVLKGTIVVSAIALTIAACAVTAGIACLFAAATITGLAAAGQYGVESDCPTVKGFFVAGTVGFIFGLAGGYIGSAVSDVAAEGATDNLTDTIFNLPTNKLISSIEILESSTETAFDRVYDFVTDDSRRQIINLFN